MAGTRDEIDYAKSLIDSNIECEMEIREKRRQRDVSNALVKYCYLSLLLNLFRRPNGTLASIGCSLRSFV